MKHEMVEHLPRHGASEGQAALDAASCPVAVDLAVFTLAGRELSVLLSQRREAPYPGFWALPGGLHRPGTSLDDQARSLHQGITGLEAGWIEQLKTFHRPQQTDRSGQVVVPGRDPRGDVIAVAYIAIVPSAQAESCTAAGDGSDQEWHPVRRLPVQMAFDHREIVDYAVRRLRSKVGYSSLGFQLLPSEFTISELQHVYEAVLGLSINRGNFWRKVVDRGVIEPTGKERSVRGKRAYLFRFTQQAFGLREEPDGFIEA
ncbi:MAG: NUDIX hydrolase [Chloroflexi bacterium]|jgi:8-oxo-dGTP diphosphatase|nr:MAG: NUDIX hydrolase [Chloroflexota bacterium]TME58334.1 MAG: NUDIX hydrolase [Chloroflexota bacterium]